jgi:von Willebrand factor type A domain/Inner membrane component of T3SS, cytoplasmic domain
MWSRVLLGISLLLIPHAPVLGAESLRVGPVYTRESGMVSVVVELPPGVSPTAGDFRLLVDDNPVATAQRIRPFRDSGQGIALAVCVDVSGTMAGKPLEDAKKAVLAFLNRARPEDRIALISFADAQEIESSFGETRGHHSEAVRKLKTRGTKTRLYQTIYETLDFFEDPTLPKRRRIVVISDGKDEGSVKDAADVIDKANKLGIPIDTVGRARIEEQYAEALRAISNSTGGYFEHARRDMRNATEALAAIYDKLSRSPVVDFQYKPDDSGHTTQNAWVELRRGDQPLWRAAVAEAIPQAVMTPMAGIVLETGSTSLVANGTSSILITATLVTSTGDLAGDGITVNFTTDLGRFSTDGAKTATATTGGGTGSVLIQFGSEKDVVGTATIVANVGGVAQSIQIALTGAGAPATIILEPDSTTISIFGTTGITAQVLDDKGNPVADGTAVFFRTSLAGTGVTLSDTTVDGMATAIFSAGTQSGVATVVATSGTVSAAVSIQARIPVWLWPLIAALLVAILVAWVRWAKGKKVPVHESEITPASPNDFRSQTPGPEIGSVKLPPRTLVGGYHFPVPGVGGPTAVLLGVSGAMKGQQFSIEKEIVHIGAQPGNDLSIVGDDYLSGDHAYLLYKQGSLFLFDKGSTNGTFVNRQEVTATGVALSLGDHIQLGTSVFELVKGPG